MEILDIIKNLASNGGLSALIPVINALKDNSFDLQKTLNNIAPETLAKLGGELIKSAESSQTFNEVKKNGVSPIANIADKDIVYTLNRYISAEY